ncbi:hypothetical protein PoB_000204200 [Plakobranchus ocellatus]|uniref:Uncharacterized protein n=1 Tax=Plakobranchus ocellatus TaxID=259542 RepID=A0AAV3XZF4_9GAST|nr:hypothetical protein PoB_000204200 [Plakobranchus ocellatus]
MSTQSVSCKATRWKGWGWNGGSRWNRGVGGVFHRAREREQLFLLKRIKAFLTKGAHRSGHKVTNTIDSAGTVRLYHCGGAQRGNPKHELMVRIMHSWHGIAG